MQNAANFKKYIPQEWIYDWKKEHGFDKSNILSLFQKMAEKNKQKLEIEAAVESSSNKEDEESEITEQKPTNTGIDRVISNPTITTTSTSTSNNSLNTTAKELPIISPKKRAREYTSPSKTPAKIQKIDKSQKLLDTFFKK